MPTDIAALIAALRDRELALESVNEAVHSAMAGLPIAHAAVDDAKADLAAALGIHGAKRHKKPQHRTTDRMNSGSIPARALAHFRAHPDKTFAPVEVQAAIGAPRTSLPALRLALSESLLDKGLITRIDRGQYRLAPAVTAPVPPATVG